MRRANQPHTKDFFVLLLGVAHIGCSKTTAKQQQAAASAIVRKTAHKRAVVKLIFGIFRLCVQKNTWILYIGSAPVCVYMCDKPDWAKVLSWLSGGSGCVMCMWYARKIKERNNYKHFSVLCCGEPISVFRRYLLLCSICFHSEILPFCGPNASVVKRQY